MHWNFSALRGYTIEAAEGQIGTVSDVLFDDQSWQLRWLVVHTGLWLFGRKILLPLSSLGAPDRDSRSFTAPTTGTEFAMPRMDDAGPRYQNETDATLDDGDTHLRSVNAMTGYHIEATDGPIGHVEDFIAEADGWHIRFVTIDTKNWLPSQRVVIPPHLVRDIDRLSRAIYLTAMAAKIKSSPPYDPAMTEDGPFNNAFEDYFGLKIPDGKTTIAPKISA